MSETIFLDKHEVVIDKEYYEMLKDSLELLNNLVACGVDNWEGYDNAFTMYQENKLDE